jgi:hypothetical protein
MVINKKVSAGQNDIFGGQNGRGVHLRICARPAIRKRGEEDTNPPTNLDEKIMVKVQPAKLGG